MTAHAETGPRRGTLVPFLAASAAAFVVLLFSMDRVLMLFDEGVYYTGAREVMAGQLIHRDFHTFYGPGLFYLLAGLFKLTPYQFIAGRIFATAIYALLVGLIFVLPATRARPALRALAAGSVVLLLYAFPLMVILPEITVAAAIGASVLVLRGIENGTALPFFAAGVLAGITALLRYDCGAFTVIANMLALTACCLMGAGRRNGVADWLRHGISYGLGTALAFLPAALAFLSQATFADFNADILDYSLHLYAPNRQLPFPSPGHLRHVPADLGVYLPLLIFAAAVFCVARAQRDPADAGRDDRAWLAVFGTLTAFLFLKGMVRVSWEHMIMALSVGALVVPVAAEHLLRGGRLLRWGGLGLLGALTFTALAAAGSRTLMEAKAPDPLLGPYALQRLAGAPPAPAGCTPGATLAYAALAPKEWRLVEFMTRYTAPDERIYLGSEFHDRAFANEVSLYFASNRRPGTKWYQLDPGLTTRADIQREMIADLQRNTVRWIVLDNSFTAYREPNLSAQSSGVHLLDQFIRTRYRPVAQADNFVFWLAKGVPAPALPPKAPCLPEPLPGA